MDVRLNYGRGKLSVNMPSDWDISVIRKPVMPIISDVVSAVEECLAKPVGSLSLQEISSNAKSACILVCDITRPVPNKLFLGPVIKNLLASGLKKENIVILVATGLHRPNEGSELEELIGDSWVLQTVRVENHFAKNDGDHIYVGTTTKGNKVFLDRRFVEADIRIATGLVEPHFMAGYSGGRKVIAPGIANVDTITTFHSSRYMEHPLSANCILEGNPLHEDQLEIIEMIGGALAINTVIDDKRRLSFINFGEIVISHLEAVDFIRKYAEVYINQKFKTILTSCAGYPLDLTYYQTVKGMVAPMNILEPGGNLIIVSDCSEGMGSKEFVDSQRRLIEKGPDEFLSAINLKKYADIDEWQTEMQIKPMKLGSIHLYSKSLSDQAWPLTGVNRVFNLSDCIEKCVFQSGANSIAVIPEGPYVVPILSELK